LKKAAAALLEARLYGFGVEMEHNFIREYILTEIDDIKIAVDGVLDGIGRVYTLDEQRKYEIRLVMNELLVNCFAHAHPEGRQTVVLRVVAKGARVRIFVKDNGQGFEYEKAQQNLEQLLGEDMLYREHGRGLKLVRAFCQDIEYFGNGNSVEVKIAL